MQRYCQHTQGTVGISGQSSQTLLDQHTRNRQHGTLLHAHCDEMPLRVQIHSSCSDGHAHGGDGKPWHSADPAILNSTARVSPFSICCPRVWGVPPFHCSCLSITHVRRHTCGRTYTRAHQLQAIDRCQDLKLDRIRKRFVLLALGSTSHCELTANY